MRWSPAGATSPRRLREHPADHGGGLRIATSDCVEGVVPPVGPREAEQVRLVHAEGVREPRQEVHRGELLAGLDLVDPLSRAAHELRQPGTRELLALAEL